MKSLLITGSNKGLGYAIIEELLSKKSKLNIILSARNDELGQKSFKTLSEKYPEEASHFFYHQLDITKEDSISNFISWLKEKFGKLDYLVDNAGLGTQGDLTIELVNKIFEVNVEGTINFTERMLKENLINKSGKIILLGSIAGLLNRIKSVDLKNEFRGAKTVEKLLELGNRFKESVIKKTVEEEGWYPGAYTISKIIVNSYARVLSYRDEIKNNDISVFAVHPGWVKTDMGGPKAPLSIEEGIKTEIYLIELPDGINPEFQGKYFDKCKVVDFEDDNAAFNS